MTEINKEEGLKSPSSCFGKVFSSPAISCHSGEAHPPETRRASKKLEEGRF